jgi:hypothetical protein
MEAVGDVCLKTVIRALDLLANIVAATRNSWMFEPVITCNDVQYCTLSVIKDATGVDIIRQSREDDAYILLW